jgi:RHS repeat-associated protein
VPIGTTADLCALALGTDQYYVKHEHASGVRKKSTWTTSGGTALAGGSILNLTIDPNTGLPSSSTDAAGVRTDLLYDPLGRPAAERPTTGNGAWTEYRWFKATSATAQARVEVYQRPNGSTTTNLAQSRIYFDPHGRPWRDWVLGANGVWTTVDTGWSSMGWKRSVSERQAVPPANFTTFQSFDPFGRPTLIVPPDGLGHKVTLAYTGDRIVSRTVYVNEGAAKISATTTEQYDRQGRLWKVTEPSGTGGTQVTTTYGYDVGGRLSSVSTTGQGRTFSYDNRGFLAWERHPEKGVSGNGYVRYLDYDALGNVGRKLDAVGTASATTGADSDLTFTYDRLSRLTQVKATGGAVHKAFTYGTGGTTKDAGKVLTADRYNYIQIGTTPFTVQVKETYAYAGVGGAVSSRATQLYVNGGAAESFTQGWSWNDLGDVTTLTYPRCTHAGCSGAAATSRNVGFGYTNGFLTSVPNYANTISYHPNGMVNQVAHSNGVTWTQAAAPYGMARPASYETAGAATNWTSGTYVYDGSGNVSAIGGSTFSYDPVSRLTASSLKTGVVAGSGTTATQTVAYDGVGNLTSMATNGSALTLTTSTSTNRLASSTFDTMGSMTTWSGNSYLYDDFAMAWRVTASGVAYQHLYTADDERIWTFQSGAPSRWTLRDLDGSVLREFKNNAGTWTVERDCVHRDGTLLAAVTTTPETTHFHPDHLGTPRLITGAGGAFKSYHAYHPYGTEATAFNQDGERRKFTGHERDLGITTSTADDIDYMHARFYNMQIGRFTSVDPVGGNARVPQSWNRFSYVRGKAMTHYDPTGLRDTGLAASVEVTTQFYDEITVVASFNGAAPGPGAAEAQGSARRDNATFRNFLFGNHAGGGGFRSQHNRNRSELGLSVREYANHVAAQGGGGSCASYSCQVLAGVGDLAPFAEVLDQAAIQMSMVIIPGPFDEAAVALKGEQFLARYATVGFDQSVSRLGSFSQYAVSVPGKATGSYTRWVKTLNAQGRTVRMYHDTIDKTGRFIHRSIKVPGPTRHVR